MSDNIIPFPKGKKGSPPQSIEESIAEINLVRSERIDDMLSELIPMVLSILHTSGFDVYDLQYAKDNAMLFESLKALMMKIYNMDHPLHPVAETIFSVSSSGEEGFNYTYDFDKSSKDENLLT